MDDSSQETHTETADAQGPLDHVGQFVTGLGEAVEHVAAAGYNLVNNQIHLQATTEAEAHHDQAALEEHGIEAGIYYYGVQNELNAAREAVGIEPVDYDAGE